MVADMVAFVASQFTTSTWDVGAQELCSVVLIIGITYIAIVVPVERHEKLHLPHVLVFHKFVCFMETLALAPKPGDEEQRAAHLYEADEPPADRGVAVHEHVRAAVELRFGYW